MNNNMKKQGEIWLANLNPNYKSEPGKTRPVLIIQTQALIEASHPSTIVIPLTTNLIDSAEPLRLRIKAKEKLLQDSDLLIDQIRSIDNSRFTDGPLLKLPKSIMKKILGFLNEIMEI